MKQYIILLFFILAISACKKNEKCPNYFKLPVHITPEKSIYNAGDTLTFVSKFHKDLPAYNSSRSEIMDRTFDMEGVFWSPNALIKRTDTLVENFTASLIPQNFVFLPNEAFDFHHNINGGLRGEYSFEKDTFKLRYQIICKIPGTYFLTLGTYLPRRNTQDYPGRCSGNNFDVWYKANEGLDNNIDFLLESPIESWHSWVTNDASNAFHRTGGYCFKVE